ncbi:hypothetical protein HBI38_150690 [Parastagonospora nodorum]|nr:hypothetical protein HBH86_167150 [Parastagonospora nodorum]KAH4985247.1 hypothetical protein HBI76_133130 [Parastagonospora nodorum]KAH5452328.1 hypothetical protein HBI30_122550 [Parastagonospora nodorum]KAH5671719.1 hypothetical protein HBI21_169950 [Parastagonospora nodorum]KAH5804032.1 hypothetical protein HBI96_128450 [Parastagonospora nodorum]
MQIPLISFSTYTIRIYIIECCHPTIRHVGNECSYPGPNFRERKKEHYVVTLVGVMHHHALFALSPIA